jgi:hypothetical protein
MRAGYVAVIGLSLGFVWVACSDDTSSNPTGGSGGGSTTSSTGAAGASGGSGGAATGGSGGAATGGSSTGGSAGSGGGSGGGAMDAGKDGSGCETACDCPNGVGCFDGKCNMDISSVYCCTSATCGMDVFKSALCQRPDKSYSRCAGLPADAGGKDGSIGDICPLFSCASGMPCPPECKGTCDMNDMCRKM